MKSRNPKKYMGTETKDNTLAKFQPIKSLIFSKMPTIQQKVKQQKEQQTNDNST
jgi:hypothetical protein